MAISKQHLRKGGLVATVALLVLAGFFFVKPDDNQEALAMRVAPQVGAVAPDFALTTLTGGSIKLSNLVGGPVLVYFWTPDCYYCRITLPELSELYSSYKKDYDLEVLAVDMSGQPNKVKTWVEENNVAVPVLLDDGVVQSRYLVRYTPTYVFIDEHGFIRNIEVGALSKAGLENKLLSIIKK